MYWFKFSYYNWPRLCFCFQILRQSCSNFAQTSPIVYLPKYVLIEIEKVILRKILNGIKVVSKIVFVHTDKIDFHYYLITNCERFTTFI